LTWAPQETFVRKLFIGKGFAGHIQRPSDPVNP
jgi:hypothetical protein